ncbi:MAG TPA: GAF domain-containing protein [Mycobacterium sp.]|nr:GAF domain-containing protein [Mycobacterium sp.]
MRDDGAGLGRSGRVARDQIEHLLAVAIEIGSDLDLDATLHRIIIAAMEMTGARYGALGRWGAEGTLTAFLYTGIDAETARLVGQLPVGKGVLGLLRERRDPLCLEDLTCHPMAVGFPEHHPPMRAFLGVPIRIRGEVFGSLYVTDDRPGRVFTDTDQIISRVLATAAAAAIDNAQLFDQARAAAKWTKASREITTALLSDGDAHVRPLQLIAERACELTEAEQGIVLIPAGNDLPPDEVGALVVSTAVGLHADEVIGQHIPVAGSTSGEVFRSGTPLITERFRRPIQAFSDVGERPAILMPLRAGERVLGVIVVARNASQPPFDPRYLDLVSDFADHAAMALTLATARDDARELTLVADRERIAHDLHDQIIQRLFAAGMDLQGTIARLHSPEIIGRLNKTVDDLQGVIDDIRLAIFDLRSRRGRHNLRRRIQDAVANLTDSRDVTATVRMSGPIGAVTPALADHAEAVIVEAVSNAVRHSGGNSITVEVAVNNEVKVDIVDNGCGIPADSQRRSGLANIQRRAEELGGTCTVSSPATGGTHVRWAVPLVDS